MKRSLWLIPFLLCLLGMVSWAWADTINVPADQSTIQAAVEAAIDGDVIQIAAGTFTEHITVNKRLSFIGAGSGNDPLTNTIITNPSGGDSKIGVFQFTASGLNDTYPILLQDIRINAVGKAALSVGRFTEATGVNVSYLKFVNVKAYGTNVNPSTEQERGFYVDLTSSASHLVFENCSFNNLTYGWYFQKQVSADTSTVEHISVTNCEFIHNNHKGLYAEKLENATFTQCTFSQNGYDASMLPSYFQPWCAGVDVNLKAGTYSSILFDTCIVTNNGIGNSKEGSGMSIKGRDDGTSYGAYPATLTNVQITNCTVTGNERGIRLGEPGKNNNTPTGVVISGGTITNNTKYYTGTDGSAYGDVINVTGLNGVTLNDVVILAGQQVWYANPVQGLQAVINAAAPGSVINVPSGTYAENIVVNKALTLKGANADTPYGSRVAGSIIAPASGLPVSVVADNVTLNGFEITAPGYQYAINCGGSYSNITIKYNYIHHIATTMNNINVHAIVYQVANGVTPVNLSITDNRIQYLGSPTHTNSSVAAIGILQSVSTGVLTGLNILRNEISDVEVSTANWPTGKLAYGIIINTGGGSGYLTSTGKVVDALVENNTIFNIKGFIATAIGMEGNTENAFVRYNNVYNLTAYKLADRAGGGYDMNALKFENNRYVGTVTVTDNVFQTDTFVHNGTPNLGYAVSNYVPSTVGVLNMSKNWYGTAVLAEILDNDTLTGKLFNKAGCVSNFLPYSTSPDLLNTLGVGPVVNATQGTSYLTIQAAINAANPAGGDVINVAAGEYPERLVVNKSLTLKGASYGVNKRTYVIPEGYAYDPSSQSIIRPLVDDANPATQMVVNITAPEVVIDGFIIAFEHAEGPGYRDLITLSNQSIDYTDVQIINNVIGPIQNTESPAFNKGRSGIVVYGPSASKVNLSIKHNKIIDANGDGCGIMLLGPSVPSTSTHPTMGATVAGTGNGWNAKYSGSIIEDNAIIGNHRSGIELAGGVDGGTEEADWFKIVNNTISSTGLDPLDTAGNLKYGNGIIMIRTGGSRSLEEGRSACNVLISGNTIENNEKNGIYIGPKSKNISIISNQISGNGTAFENLEFDGVRLDLYESYYPTGAISDFSYAESITLTGNTLVGNAGYGVQVIGTPAIEPVSAVKNWWGDTTGPFHSTNTNGLGNPVSDNVLFDPWFADENMNIMDSNAPVENVTRNLFYDTIQAAVNAANDNDVIRVDAGIYDETVTIGRPLSLIGPNADISAVTGTRVVPEAVIQQYIYIYNPVVGVSNVKIAGFEFSETDAWHAIIMIQGQTENVQILNNRFIDVPKHAIYTEAPAGGTNLNMVISGNMISGVTGTNASGMYLIRHTGGSVSNNRIEDTAYSGILVNGYCHGMTISNNQIYNVPQQGLQLAGDVANVIVSGNTIDFANTDNVSDKGGIRLYASAFTGPVLITGNTISNSFNGIAVRDGNGTLSPEQEAWIQIRDNDLSQNSNCGVYMPSGSTGNLDALENWWGSPSGPTLRNGVGVTANVLFDPWYIDDADGGYETLSEDVDLYVDATDELIKDNELQNYTVYVAEIADLLGFTVQVKVPIADFNEPVPTDFTIGPLFGSDDYQPFITSSQDATHYIFNVSIANLQNEFAGGVDGIDVALFSFNLTSITDHDNVPAGCWIEIPLDDIILRNHFNQNIPCDTATGFHVIIDATEPVLTPLGETPGLTLLIDPVKTTANGFASVVNTYLNLTFNDNYNLDYLKFKIQLSGDLDPVLADFDNEIAIAINAAAWANATWQIPDALLNAAANDLPTGNYNIWFLAVDDASNNAMWSWNFLIDKTPLDPPVWDSTIPCRTTARQNNFIDLKWANPAGTVKNHIWVKSYASLPDASGYPEYAPASDYTVPAAPNPYSVTEQNGWNQYILIDPPVAGTVYPLAIAERGYYYITVFAADASGNISAAPLNLYYRESISYWPGDVDQLPGYVNPGPPYAHTVTGADIAVLSPAWGSIDGGAGWNNIVDVGPTVDNGRRSRPTPDNVIDIEDLMIFAMNYNNTVYTYYTRDGDEELQPIQVQMHYAVYGDMLNVELYLLDNQGLLRGLNIPVAYASGLSFETLQNGDIWPEDSLVLHRDRDGILTLSGTVLGENGTLTENGLIATLSFKIEGPEMGVQLRRMIARGIDNQEIEIEDNPSEISSDEDDPVNVVPVNSYLGDNYPNPFNPSTTVRFGLKQSDNVRVNIYNARGQLIRSLVNGRMEAGNHSVVWNGTDNYNRPVSSGIYFIRMESRDCVSTKKALLMK